MTSRNRWSAGVAVAAAVACAAFLVFIVAQARENAKRARCAKQIVQLLPPLDFGSRSGGKSLDGLVILGTEPTTGKGSGGPPRSSDASRSFAFRLKLQWYGHRIESAELLACPSDPFVVPLDAAALTDDDTDLPTEGFALGASRWAAPASTAALEDGRTWFSYSMQTGSRFKQAGPHAAMLPKIPLFSDRNPECAVFADIGAGASGPPGNSWNHKREGQNLAFTDGHVAFSTDAGALELWIDPTVATPMVGFDHLFADERGASSSGYENRRCIPPGTAGLATTFGAWMTD